MNKYIFLSVFLIHSFIGFTQSDQYLLKPSSNLRILYDKDLNVLNSDNKNYIYFVDLQTDKNGDILGYINFKLKTGQTISQERWIKISKTHHDKNVINEVKLYDYNTGNISSHLIINNPENLSFEVVKEGLNGYLYEFNNGKLKGLKSFYNGKIITEVKYNENAIDQIISINSFDEEYYWSKILFDKNQNSYKLIQDDLKEPSWINWNKEFANPGIYTENSFQIKGTIESGGYVFRELPYNTEKDFSVNIRVKRISGSDFTGMIFGAQNGGLRNFWNFSISEEGFYQIIKVFNGVIMPLNLRNDRFDELPDHLKTNEIDYFLAKNIPVGYSKEINLTAGFSNTLDIKKIGKSLIFSINGKIVEQIDQTEIFGTGTGFIVTKNRPGSIQPNIVNFSDFYLTEFSPDIPEWIKINPLKDNIATASGTGFSVSQKGIICTNYHVIKGAKKIHVIINGKKEEARLLLADEKNDLALIKITNEKLITKKIPFIVNYNNPQIGDNIFVLGFPSSNILGRSIKLTNGVISSIKGLNDDKSTIQISAPIQPGNSGSPLFNEKGIIIGIINSGIPSLENVGYAIKANILSALLKKSNIKPISSSLIGESESLANKAKKISDFIFLIEVEL